MIAKQEKLNAVFSALSDPTRRRILERLSVNTEVSVTDLAEPFFVSLPAISRHLRVLEDARLINRRRHGRTHNIRANKKGIDAAKKWIAQYAQFWESRFDAIDELLEKKKRKKQR